MYLLNLEFETQIRLQTFCRNLHHKSRKYVNSVYLIYMQVKEISETKVEQCKSFFFWFFYRIRNKLQFFEFKLKIYTWIRWEQADYDFFCHGGIIKLKIWSKLKFNFALKFKYSSSIVS